MGTLVTLLLLLKTIKGFMLTTTFIDDNGSDGNMFDVSNIASIPIFIQRFAVHSITAGSITVIIYTKSDTYVGFTDNPAAWTQIHSESVIPSGKGIATELSLLQNTVTIPVGSTQAFYITTSSGLRYTNDIDGSEGLLYVSDSNIAIYIGVGLGGWTNVPFTPRIWNGIVYYSTTSSPTSLPTTSPTIDPTPSPTTNPTPSPTINPTYVPTKSPTKNPTFQPTKSPTKNPTIYPTFQPTLNPTFVPTLSPSNNPTMYTVNPTLSPTENPTTNPTKYPTLSPSPSPTLPEGGIKDDYTTTEEVETTRVAGEKSSNFSEKIFGSFLYVILTGIAVLLLCCIVGFIIFCGIRLKKDKKSMSNIETNSEFETNLHNMVASHNNINFSPSVAELLPLPTEEDQQRITPMELHDHDENVLVTPFSEQAVELTPYMEDNAIQKCEHCESIKEGKMDRDGRFYCNACWLEFVDTNDDGEAQDNELYDVIPAQQMMGNADETPM